jgi:hypothetical protein
MNLNNHPLNPRLGNWVVKNLNATERILLVIIGIGMGLKMAQLEIGAAILPVPFSALAVLYFFRAQAFFENAKNEERFFNKLLPMGWSICIIGIMFIIMGWPGYDPMLIVGAFPQLVILLMILFLKQSKGITYSTLNKSVMVRSALIISIALLFHFCPKETFIKYHITSEHHLQEEDVSK